MDETVVGDNFLKWFYKIEDLQTSNKNYPTKAKSSFSLNIFRKRPYQYK